MYHNIFTRYKKKPVLFELFLKSILFSNKRILYWNFSKICIYLEIKKGFFRFWFIKCSQPSQSYYFTLASSGHCPCNSDLRHHLPLAAHWPHPSRLSIPPGCPSDGSSEALSSLNSITEEVLNFISTLIWSSVCHKLVYFSFFDPRVARKVIVHPDRAPLGRVKHVPCGIPFPRAIHPITAGFFSTRGLDRKQKKHKKRGCRYSRGSKDEKGLTE